MSEKSISQHNIEIARNAKSWENKPLLRTIYKDFYQRIASELDTFRGEEILEIGSGIGAIKTVLPECITSDIFPNSWLDRVENAYNLQFPDKSLRGIILFDVWHHLQYPGLALKEFARVLKPGGRVVLFEPAMGLTGHIIYGLFHHEPLGLRKRIEWEPPNNQQPELRYYAAQGNCWRIFHQKTSPVAHYNFEVTNVRLMSALTYVASGGFAKPQLYPNASHRFVRGVERILDKMPSIFSTRMLVTLTTKTNLHGKAFTTCRL